MPTKVKELVSRRPASRWVEYLVKAAVLLAVFLLIARHAPTMPPACLAILWAILSICAAISLTYHYVINKARNRAGLEDGGVVARINDGRSFSLLLAFVAMALCVGGLILELPKWEAPEWVAFIVAIPLYIGIFKFMQNALKSEYKPLLRVSRSVAASSGVLCAALLLVFVIIVLVSPVTHYENMTEAFLGAKQPFANSPSALLADLGYLGALVDGLTEFAMSRVSESSPIGAVAWRIALCASTAIGISTLVGACSLKLDEVKLVFLPLSAVDNPEADHASKKLSIAMACVLPVILVAASAAVNAKVNEMAETEGYTMVRAAIREQVGMAACVIDGKKYDYEKVQGLYEKARELSDDLATAREAELTPLINDVYDKRIENVDAYLDWYYGLPADYERLVQFFAGTIEDGMKEQLAERINEGVDETGLEEAMGRYWEQSLQIKEDIESELSRYELGEYGFDDVPEWLVVPVKTLESNFLTEPLEPCQKFLDAGQRMGLSVGVGIVAGVIAKRATEKVLAKPFFKKIIASLMEKLAARGLLAAGGTAIAPGVGTAVGFGIGFAGDYLFLKVDEAMNRDAYREEIVSAIEESRTQMLEMVSA